MLLSIQTDSPVPIYEQIVTQVIFGIASGGLEPGTMIPSVRELAQRVLVHPNTVARAFQELERQGVVAAVRGRGMEVTVQAPALCRVRRRQIIQQRIAAALREAVASALEPDEVRRLVEEELARVNGRNGNDRDHRHT
jgi:GntR family transcriptional regulator